MLKNPHVLARMIETNRKVLCPYWMEFIREGQEDGSIPTQYPKELAEFLVLMDVWLIPSVFRLTKQKHSTSCSASKKYWKAWDFLCWMRTWWNISVNCRIFRIKRKTESDRRVKRN